MNWFYHVDLPVCFFHLMQNPGYFSSCNQQMQPTQCMRIKRTHIYQPAPWPASPEPPAGRPGLPCFQPTLYLDSHSRHWPAAGLQTNTDK